MAATSLQLNYTNVSFGNATLIRINSIMFTQGGQLLDYAGDNNRYPVVIANPMNKPRCSINSSDPGTLFGLNPGNQGTLTATQKDALAGVGGDILFTMLNAIHENTEDTGQFGQYATATATFAAYSNDGSTSPLSFARV